MKMETTILASAATRHTLHLPRRTTPARMLSILAALSLTWLVACGGESQDGIDAKQAKVVQKAAGDAVGGLMKQHLLADLDSLVGGDASGWLSGDSDAFNVDGLMPGDLGGELSVSGTGSLPAGSTDPTDLALGLDVGFKSWKDASGVVLDGALSLVPSIDSLVPPKLKIKAQGTLDVSGACTGKVPVDLSFDLSGTSITGCGTVDGIDTCLGALSQAAAGLVQAEISTAMALLQQKLGPALATLAAGQLPPGVGDLITGTKDGFDIDGVIASTLGGSMQVKGNGAATGAAAYDVDLDAQLKQWAGSSGIILDGALKADYTINSVDPLDITITLSGDVDLSGTESGSASVQLTISTNDGEASVCGTIAGHAIAQGSCS